MKTNSAPFDLIHGCQRLFRQILHAMANPGIWVDCPDLSGEFHRDGLLLPLLLTLCDPEASYWLSNCPVDLAQEVALLCGAREASLGEADFVFVTEDLEAHTVLRQVRPGSFLDPHDSATIFILLSPYEEMALGIQQQKIHGPGIPPGGRVIELPHSALTWLHVRRELAFEYPLGVDLVLVHPDGKLLALPRTTKG
ncbi:MAG: phosphonate C-P lyase system protein PhnH [Symbiobacteriaceae bacterium]|nr:phosphonate C-P lyase system protein PhnH [Symbiobacteriaceae bacterium]